MRRNLIASCFWVIMAAIGGCAAPDCASASTAASGDPVSLTRVGDDMTAVADAFNAHVDRVRVLELVSPTCGPCLLGARSVNDKVVKRFGEQVPVIVVWIPMLASDTLDAAEKSAAMYPAAGVTQFYDNQHLVGWSYTRGPFKGAHDAALIALPDDHWLKADLRNRPEGPAWDAYFVYAPGVRWENDPPKPTAWIKHLGINKRGRSWFWQDSYDVPPKEGDLADAIEAMVSSVVARSASQ